ncbi:MAG: NADPH-dependent FMN reductase [Cyclobacteriaceae bacterium]
MPKILAINGSATPDSSNLTLIHKVRKLIGDGFEFEVYDDLSVLPHFNTDFTDSNVPADVVKFREAVSSADGVLICTPEYVFSIPSRLKNAIEWCVSTVVFSDKPTGLITASASGVKGHEELQLIMRTVQADFNEKTTLLIQGIKGKINAEGDITHSATSESLDQFVLSFLQLVSKR